MYPLVRELAVDGIPVTVTCRVLKITRAPYYRWLAQSVTPAELVEAYRANALFDAHRDDPEFGYRFLLDEARAAGEAMSDRTAWAICSANQWWSVFGKKRAKNGKRPGPPVHEDKVKRDFTATDVNRLWLTDITEHPTGEGKLYLCAVKDVYSNRIVGYAIDSRMKSRLAKKALDSAVIRRRIEGHDVTGCVVHSDRGSQGGFNWSSQHPVVEVFHGSSSAGSRSSGTSEAAVAWASKVPASCRGRVLGADRQGCASRAGVGNCWRGSGRGRALVPQRWGYAAVRSELHAHRPLPLLR